MKLTGGTQQTKREFFEESIFYFDRFIKKNKKEMEKKEVGERGKAKKKVSKLLRIIAWFNKVIHILPVRN